VIQARMGSSRLPGKVLLPLAGQPSIVRLAERVTAARRVDRLVVATSTASGDDVLAQVCREAGLDVVRGPEDDVLARFVTASAGAEWVVRITGDCPLIDPEVIDRVVMAARQGTADYASNTDPPTYPDGMDVEAFTRELLVRADKLARTAAEREHVTPWMRREGNARRINVAADHDLSDARLTVDEPEDYVVVAAVWEALRAVAPAFTLSDIMEFLRTRPELVSMNGPMRRNEAFIRPWRLR